MENEVKVQICTSLFIHLVKYIYFDTASPQNPNSHVLSYLRSFINRYLFILLKNDSSPTCLKRRVELAYTILAYCECLIKSVYSLVNTSEGGGFLFLCTDSIRTQPNTGLDEQPQPHMIDGPNQVNSQALDNYSLKKEQHQNDALLVKQARLEKIQFGDLILENVSLYKI